MQAVLNDLVTVQNDGYHNAFTSLASWRGRTWLAFRRAATHSITPPGTIEIYQGDSATSLAFQTRFSLKDQETDLRDPRFLATPDALYCMVGSYVPSAPRKYLSTDSAENVVRTMLTHTVDGDTWTPLIPILRPNYWGWSPVKMTNGYCCAAYHTGNHREPSSIVLWSGTSLYQMAPHVVCYDGASLDTEQAPHYMPSEPVLFGPHQNTLACYARTEQTMDLGISTFPYQNWRWRATPYAIHPSATLPTPSGQRLLVGRSIEPRMSSWGTRNQIQDPFPGIWLSTAQELTLLLQLPGGGDCAYAGIIPGPGLGDYQVSYYAQANQGRRAGLPGAAIYLATIHLSD